MPMDETDTFIENSDSAKNLRQHNLLEQTPVFQTSSRLFIVHALHTLLLLITLIILVIGTFHWEHIVYIDSIQVFDPAYTFP